MRLWFICFHVECKVMNKQQGSLGTKQWTTECKQIVPEPDRHTPLWGMVWYWGYKTEQNSSYGTKHKIKCGTVKKKLTVTKLNVHTKTSLVHRSSHYLVFDYLQHASIKSFLTFLFFSSSLEMLPHECLHTQAHCTMVHINVCTHTHHHHTPSHHDI